jgi:FkbH-like protein
LTFAGKVKALRELEPQADAWQKVSFRVLRNYTLENVEPLVRFECAQFKIDASMTFSAFDNFEQEVIDPQSPTNADPSDIVVVSLWMDDLFGQRADSFEAGPIVERVTGLLDRLIKNTPSTLVLTSFLPPFFAIGGARVGKTQNSVLECVREVNRMVESYAQNQERIHVIDLSAISARLGAEASVDPRFWYLYKAPLKNEALSVLASELAQLAVGIRGAAKKVLVLDCDNTLWGGIIGEDGIEGIALDPNSYPGAAFYDFQRQILALKNQGVLISICSKNNEADVLNVLEQHPHSLLRTRDLAAWRINWESKVANLRELADDLNLGIDSLVLIDDSPAECAFVRESLPEVAVLTVPANLYELPGVLRQYRGFDRPQRSKEDEKRTEMYRQERLRRDTRKDFEDLEAYLKALELVVEIAPAKADDLARVAQLTQKTNQFNLTTRRYSQGEIETMAASPNHLVLTMRVRDRFGDYGLTGVGILTFAENVAHIDSLLLSCRVLGRQAEFALLSRLIKGAWQRPGVTVVKGYFLPTPKNKQVEDLYDRAGFARLASSQQAGEKGEGGSDGAREYSFEIGSRVVEPAHCVVTGN